MPLSTPLSTKLRRPLLLLFLTLALTNLEPSQACGPFTPTSVLGGGDATLLGSPVADFQHEISLLLPNADPTLVAIVPPKESWHPPDYAAQTNDADVADLLAATGDKNLAAELEAWRKKLRAIPPDGKPAPDPGNPPAGLPVEFALYEIGARNYHAGDLPAARAQWQKLLDLPEKDRKHRTLWASYMIARSYVDSDPAKAAPLFVKIPQLAKPLGPCDDPIGLASASLGWQARALWKQNRPADISAAITLFLQQVRAGEPLALWSLRDCAKDLLAGDEARLLSAAQNSPTRQIITAYILSGGTPFTWKTSFTGNSPEHTLAARWLKILGSLDLKDLPGADRLAWAAYSVGDMKTAQRWLTLGGKNGIDTPIGQWIQAKLFLRDGKTADAAACLAHAAKAFPISEDWPQAIDNPADDHYAPRRHAAGELALLKLARRQYTEALDLLFKNNYTDDADYIAERVLTPEELIAYVDRNIPTNAPEAAGEDHPALGETYPLQLRELLARRLTRLGRWKEARPYFSPDHQQLLDQYVAAIRTGHNEKKPAHERAAALWNAAKIAHDRGDEFLATALDPGYDATPPGLVQLLPARETSKLAPLTPDEKSRVTKSAPDPNTRYPYRYTATDHAWEAAKLMPSDTDELATLFIEAGSWVKAKDPKAADRFYKALVTRCPSTTLGQQAEKLHWFPPLHPTTQPATSTVR